MNTPDMVECEFCSHNEFEKTQLNEDYLHCIANKYGCWLYPLYSLQAIKAVRGE